MPAAVEIVMISRKKDTPEYRFETARPMAETGRRRRVGGARTSFESGRLLI